MRRVVLTYAMSVLSLAGCGGTADDLTGAKIARPSDAMSQPVERVAFRRFLPGLGVHADYVTSFVPGVAAPRKFVRIDGGEPLAPGRVAELERNARWSRWGGIEPHLASLLSSLSPEEQVSVAVVVRGSTVVQVPRATRSLEEEAALGEAAQQLLMNGLVRPRVSPRMPVIYGTARVEDVRRIGRLASVLAVLSNSPGTPRIAAAPNAISFLQIDTGANASGFYGAGQQIGFIETPSCGMYDPHERFASTTITYHYEPDQCDEAVDCEGLCRGGIENPLVIFGHTRCEDLSRGFGSQCVWQHVAQAASSAVAARGGGRLRRGSG